MKLLIEIHGRLSMKNIKCKYCDNDAVEIILRMMQPSYPAPSCKDCYLKRVGKGYVDYNKAFGRKPRIEVSDMFKPINK